MSTRLGRTVAAIERGIEQRLHLGAQLYVSLRDEVIADEAIGQARTGEAMTGDTVMLWLSAGKPLAAVAIAQLWERRLLDLDDPVARHIPAFAAGGKESITIRHVLTHTAGFRGMAGFREDVPWDEMIGIINGARIEPRWIPGVTAGYHPVTSWYVLGELVRVLDGRTYDQYVREMIFTPLGMRHSDALPPPHAAASPLYDTKNPDEPTPHPLNDARRISPGSSARGPARDLARFYQALNHRGESLITPQSTEALTARHRTGIYDGTFRHVIDFGLGFILQSNLYGLETVPYNYGPHASPRTFGHSGARSSVGYCDPEHHLVVACIFNGMPIDPQHDARMREVNRLIYEELDLAQH